MLRPAPVSEPVEFEHWLRTVCFQKPTPEAYDLAKDAWKAALNTPQPCPRCSELEGILCHDCLDTGWLENREDGRYPCTCVSETEPYQELQAKLDALTAPAPGLRAYHNPISSVSKDIIPFLFEAYDYGQFADDFDQPLALPIRSAIRQLLDKLRITQNSPPASQDS